MFKLFCYSHPNTISLTFLVSLFTYRFQKDMVRKDEFEDLAVENVKPFVVAPVIWNKLLEIASPDYLHEIKEKHQMNH